MKLNDFRTWEYYFDAKNDGFSLNERQLI